MIRSWEIIRDILIRLESSETPDTIINANDFSGFEKQNVAYNMQLLADEGYINANIQVSNSGDGKIITALARSLTGQGHDLLDTIRNDTIWKKIQEKFKSEGIKMTFDTVLAVGKNISLSILD